MKILVAGVVTLLLAVTPATAQLSGREYTNPSVPPRQALDRLGLKMAWRVYLPVTGRRDGIYSVQFADKQILVQTIKGVVISLEADSGDIQWKARVGNSYRVTTQLGYNNELVFVVRGHYLVALDRASGRMEWKYVMPGGASAAPVADDAGVYLCISPNWIYAYELPDIKQWKRLRKNQEKKSQYNPEESLALSRYGGASGISAENLTDQRKDLYPEPDLAWQFLFEEGRLLQTPLQTSEALLLASTTGYIFSASKFVRNERYRFKAEAPVSAPLGQHGDMAYVASEDFNLYAVSIPAGKVRWRFTSGAPILQKPAVTDKDVFLVADRRGLFRVNRGDGIEAWRNRKAKRFLAVNKKFVYAFDRNNRLLVLDRVRGTQLGMLDTRGFVFPISNEMTDRLFLASHNGLLVCLHDKNQQKPLVNKKVEEKKIKGFEPKEGAEKPKEEKKKKKPKKKPKEDEDEKEDKKEKKKKKKDDDE